MPYNPTATGVRGLYSKDFENIFEWWEDLIYIIPQQERIDTTPLPYDAEVFQHMPKHVCMSCGQSVPLPLLQFHIDSCGDVSYLMAL